MLHPYLRLTLGHNNQVSLVANITGLRMVMMACIALSQPLMETNIAYQILHPVML